MESKTKNKKTREQIERMAARAFGGITLADGADAVYELKEGWLTQPIMSGWPTTGRLF